MFFVVVENSRLPLNCLTKNECQAPVLQIVLLPCLLCWALHSRFNKGMAGISRKKHKDINIILFKFVK